MRETQHVLKHETKGELMGFQSQILKVVGKKDEQDSIDFGQLLTDIADFAKQNQGKNVVVKFVATASESE